jgi:hypothetical protein
MKNTSMILRRALRYGILLTLGIAIVGGVVGYLTGGGPGLASALLGAAVTLAFMGLTTVSFLVAARVAKLPEGIVVYYGIILGTMFVKFAIFFVLILSLRNVAWLNPTIFGLTLIVAVLGNIVVDMLAVGRGRVLYTDVTLPGEDTGQAEKSASDS